MSIEVTDEPIQCCARESSHEQFAMHGVGSPRDHHLSVGSRDVGLWVFSTCESDFWSHEIGGYHDTHDRMGEWHGASLN